MEIVRSSKHIGYLEAKSVCEIFSAITAKLYMICPWTWILVDLNIILIQTPHGRPDSSTHPIFELCNQRIELTETFSPKKILNNIWGAGFRNNIFTRQTVILKNLFQWKSFKWNISLTLKCQFCNLNENVDTFLFNVSKLDFWGTFCSTKILIIWCFIPLWEGGGEVKISIFSTVWKICFLISRT